MSEWRIQCASIDEYIEANSAGDAFVKVVDSLPDDYNLGLALIFRATQRGHRSRYLSTEVTLRNAGLLEYDDGSSRSMVEPNRKQEQ